MKEIMKKENKKYTMSELQGKELDTVFIRDVETGNLVLTLYGGGRLDVYLDELDSNLPLHLIKGEMEHPEESPDVMFIMNSKRIKENSDVDIPEIEISLQSYVRVSKLPDKSKKSVRTWIQKEGKNT